jgi:thioredoxin-dependent peroxiredoxin
MSDVTLGQLAPDFRLPTDEGDIVTTESLKGKTIILYFYPKADTTGCTAQALAFTGLKADFDAANAVVIGVSKDPVAKLKKFRQKYDLTIKLGSDHETQVAETFGVWIEKSMYGRSYMGIDRSTFVVSPDGKITHIWRKVKVAGHSEEVLRVVQKLGDQA